MSRIQGRRPSRPGRNASKWRSDYDALLPSLAGGLTFLSVRLAVVLAVLHYL